MVIYATDAPIYSKRGILRDIYVASWWHIDCIKQTFSYIRKNRGDGANICTRSCVIRDELTLSSEFLSHLLPFWSYNFRRIAGIKDNVKVGSLSFFLKIYHLYEKNAASWRREHAAYFATVVLWTEVYPNSSRHKRFV